MRFNRENTDALRKCFIWVMNKYQRHQQLLSAELNILYVWRIGEKFDDGKRVYAEVFKLSNRDRDIYGYDARIEVDAELWPTLTKQQKVRIADHELMHIMIEREGELDDDIEENSEDDTRDFRYDKEGRLCFHLVPHDVDIRRFTAEIMEYGLEEGEDELRKFLNTAYEERGIMESTPE